MNTRDLNQRKDKRFKTPEKAEKSTIQKPSKPRIKSLASATTTRRFRLDELRKNNRRNMAPTISTIERFKSEGVTPYEAAYICLGYDPDIATNYLFSSFREEVLSGMRPRTDKLDKHDFIFIDHQESKSQLEIFYTLVPDIFKKDIWTRNEVESLLKAHKYQIPNIRQDSEEPQPRPEDSEEIHTNVIEHPKPQNAEPAIGLPSVTKQALDEWRIAKYPQYVPRHNCFIKDFEPLARQIYLDPKNAIATEVAYAFKIPPEQGWTIFKRILDAFFGKGTDSPRSDRSIEYHVCKWFRKSPKKQAHRKTHSSRSRKSIDN